MKVTYEVEQDGDRVFLSIHKPDTRVEELLTYRKSIDHASDLMHQIDCAVRETFFKLTKD